MKKSSTNKLTQVFVVCLLFLASSARAELVIEITQGQDNPATIAVVPFAWKGGGVAPEDVAAIIGADLQRSGAFAPLPKEDMLGTPHEQKDVFFRDWKALGVDYLAVGKIHQGRGVRPLEIQYELFDVLNQQRVLLEKIAGKPAQMRDLAHVISDKIYEKVTGIPGVAATRLIYVSAANRAERRHNFRLMASDADGAREKVLLETDQPLLSPSWSPNGKEVAYVSFESSRPAIYRQNVATGAREKLTNFRGLNSAPAWSPDGTKLAMVLSKDGNPDIYVMDLASKQLKRLTRSSAIDTEPTWFPDGRALAFTSDRGRKPQIYKVTVQTAGVERLTYEGDYNARASVLPDGSGLVMVHRTGGRFHIATQDFASERVSILTQTSLDESPSVAPNGSMIIYATQQQRRGILAAVSIDGKVKYSLPATRRDVREPAWSPFVSR